MGLDKAQTDDDVPSYLRPTRSSNHGKAIPSAKNKGWRKAATLPAARRSTRTKDRPASKQPCPPADGPVSTEGEPKLSQEMAAACASGAEAGPQARFKANRTRLQLQVDHMDALKAVPLFKNCTEEFLEILAEQVVSKVFEQGTTILRQGDFGDTMFILHIGEVDVLVGETAVAVLGSGSVFGEMAAVCKDPVAARRNATIRARSFCGCRVIGRVGLMRTLTLFPDDAAVIEVERQVRFADLKMKGIIPKGTERSWCRPAARQSGADGEDQASAIPWRQALTALSAGAGFAKVLKGRASADQAHGGKARAASASARPSMLSTDDSGKASSKLHMFVRNHMPASSSTSVARSDIGKGRRSTVHLVASTQPLDRSASVVCSNVAKAKTCPGIQENDWEDHSPASDIQAMTLEELSSELAAEVSAGSPSTSKRAWPSWTNTSGKVVSQRASDADASWNMVSRRASEGLPDLPSARHSALFRISISSQSSRHAQSSFCCSGESEPWALQHPSTRPSSPNQVSGMHASSSLRSIAADSARATTAPGEMQSSSSISMQRVKRSDKVARQSAASAASAAARVSSGPSASRKVDTRRLMKPTVNTVSRGQCGAYSIQGWLQFHQKRVQDEGPPR